MVTAAHCLFDDKGNIEENIQVLLGVTNLLKDKEYANQVRVQEKVFEMRIHPFYEPQKVNNDIAVIVLENKVDLSQPNIKIACLPTYPEISEDENFRGKNGIVTGWGDIDSGDLQASELWVLDQTVFHAQSDTLNPFRKISAGSQKGRACSGDSGGPLGNHQNLLLAKDENPIGLKKGSRMNLHETTSYVVYQKIRPIPIIPNGMKQEIKLRNNVLIMILLYKTQAYLGGLHGKFHHFFSFFFNPSLLNLVIHFELTLI